MKAKKTLSIPPSAECLIAVAEIEDLPPGRDFLFEPDKQTSITLYAYLVDAKFHTVLAKNESNQTVQIPRKHRLGVLSELDYENVFFVDHTPPPKEGLQKASTGTNWFKKAATIATVAAFSISATMNSILPQQPLQQPSVAALPQASVLKPSATTPDLAKETRLDNGVIVYGNAQATTALSDLVIEFPTIW